ncbi:GNAT superfamily N-acetyltransferase [Spinactinospora alkalitolerans]|uniref:GNAT superfamily N-acetyltransferase n=1 Tax=Spinactinospora alkalitolerans TaxID=687207 RepID=A0A852TWI4_9ACTN|nr:GNAT family N-acetyltransferase [Spinactinospora alkalitolerans]NYE46210.1 GNAT superfamily N-acetyltransferase [Spinactinospora alkalitolerans]
MRAAGVELVRLDGDSPRVADLRAAVLKLRLAPGQHRFSAEAVNTLPRADADPNRTPFAVLCSDVPVGFGIVDRLGVLGEIADDPARAVLLRAFYIDPQWQGQGVGRAACAALDSLVRGIAPEATEVLLTVNEGNPAAVRAYLAGGFAHTGRRYLGGDAGPQYVLRRPVGE